MTSLASSFRRRRPLLPAAILGFALLAPGPAAAAETTGWSTSFYLQQAFPKQTRTNAQIEQINETFGVDFDTWDDVANLSLGAKLFRRVSDAWLVGIELDYSTITLSVTYTFL